MIVKMKKITLLVSTREQDAALKTLRRLGVLHVQAVRTPASEDVHKKQNEISDAEKALFILGEGKTDDKPGSRSAHEVVTQILTLTQRKETLTGELNEKREAYRWFETWGHVSLESLTALENGGVFVQFYRTDKEGLKNLPADKQIVTVAESKDGLLIAHLGRSIDDKLDLVEQRMPQYEVTELKRRIAEIESELAKIDETVKSLAPYKAAIGANQSKLKKQLEFSTVLAGMGDEQQFTYLQGFCPEDEVVRIKAAADAEGWGYIIADPDDPSEVPTLLRNKKPIRIIQPLFDFMGTYPGYQEQDISYIFLIFFSLFYAMIVGDAGYGFVFLLGTLWARLKYKKAPAEPFILFFVLSGATIVWGLITGTWFGSKALSEIPFLNIFIIEKMYSFNPSAEAQSFMMKLTFIIGVAHLTLARLIAAAKKLPSLTAIADLGWVLILWCVYFVANQLILNNPMPGFAIYLLIAGALLVASFANFQKNFLKGFLISLGNLPLSIIGSFSDVVSYIRLFAVGIATVTVAVSFNDMAGGVLAPLVLVFGHGLNIILGMMSVLVHGVRLNMLEFSGHLGQEWSGKEYKPFVD
jgi:V/A-type H+/Na+-transporting ATPase subunit I